MKLLRPDKCINTNLEYVYEKNFDDATIKKVGSNVKINTVSRLPLVIILTNFQDYDGKYAIKNLNEKLEDVYSIVSDI